MTEDLGRLYHGCVENVNFTDEQGVHVYDVALTKNTNSVKIVLPASVGEKVDDSDFHFTITDSNGLMDWDNSLLEDERLTYHAWGDPFGHGRRGCARLHGFACRDTSRRRRGEPYCGPDGEGATT